MVTQMTCFHGATSLVGTHVKASQMSECDDPEEEDQGGGRPLRPEGGAEVRWKSTGRGFDHLFFLRVCPPPPPHPFSPPSASSLPQTP